MQPPSPTRKPRKKCSPRNTMIVTVIKALKDLKGTSLQDIKKYTAMKAVETAQLIRVKGVGPRGSSSWRKVKKTVEKKKIDSKLPEILVSPGASAKQKPFKPSKSAAMKKNQCQLIRKIKRFRKSLQNW
ncbi:uncharacterized protein LOC129759528 [Uranotaenia lowii]|uniref:uncharacterized protein LOC129759528 n=1 Tax=Uranotaenia lowii TaxID=190385 RepID=UPI00247A4896|nr:uncharacterized protein LOC129759528 [Uranotaenia lowii]